MRNLVMANIAALLAGGWRRRYLVALPILLMPLAGIVVGTLAPKKYESHTTILIQEAAKLNPFLEDLAVATNLKQRMEAMNALLHSQHVLNDVVLSLGLVDRDAPDRARLQKVAELSVALRATLVGDDLVRISYVSGSPANMAEVLRLVSARFIERVVAPQRSAVSSSEEFLEQELAGRKAALVEAENALAGYKTRYASELPNLHTSNVTRLGDLRTALSERELELQGARAGRDGLRRKLAQTNPVVGRIEEQIVETLSELAVLRARYTDRHTRVQGVLRRLGSLEDERAKLLQATSTIDPSDLDRLWNLAASQKLVLEDGTRTLLVSQLQKLQEAESQIQGLEQEIRSLARDADEIERKVAGFGRHEQQLSELQRDLDVRRKIYSELAERYQNARVTGALGRWEENERVKLIDPPFTPSLPKNLPLLVFAVAGLFGGLLLGIGLAVVAELADTSIRRRGTLERLLDTPVLARIPPLPGSGDGRQPSPPHPRALAAAQPAT